MTLIGAEDEEARDGARFHPSIAHREQLRDPGGFEMHLRAIGAPQGQFILRRRYGRIRQQQNRCGRREGVEDLIRLAQ